MRCAHGLRQVLYNVSVGDGPGNDVNRRKGWVR